MDNDSIKQNLERIRQKHGLTQQEMADAIGVVRNTYRNIEKGSTHLISDTVMKVAEWAGMTPEEIVLGYEPSEDGSATLKDAREEFDRRLKAQKDDYEARLETMRKEIAFLKGTVKDKEDNIRSLKSIIAMLEKRQEEQKND